MNINTEKIIHILLLWEICRKFRDICKLHDIKRTVLLLSLEQSTLKRVREDGYIRNT